MNELIKNNVLITQVSNQIAFLKSQIEEMTNIEKEIEERIKAEMMEKGIKKLENEELSITYVDATYRETFDSKGFRKDHEDLYNDYVKMTDIKPSIRVKVKDGTSGS